MTIESIFYALPPEDSESYALLIEFCEIHRSEVLVYMPPVAALIIEGGAGFDILFKFIRRNGGLCINLAAKKSWLAENVRPEAIELLGDISFPELLIPSANAIISSLRKMIIDQEIRNIAPIESSGRAMCGLNNIARKYGVSRRYVNMRKKGLWQGNKVPA